MIQSVRLRRSPGLDSFQAYPEGSDEWYATVESTRDAPNAPDRTVDIVINEVMFDPPSDERDGEFIELFNRGTEAVDLSGWALVEGVDFAFPSGTVLEAGLSNLP